MKTNLYSILNDIIKLINHFNNNEKDNILLLESSTTQSFLPFVNHWVSFIEELKIIKSNKSILLHVKDSLSSDISYIITESLFDIIEKTLPFLEPLSIAIHIIESDCINFSDVFAIYFTLYQIFKSYECDNDTSKEGEVVVEEEESEDKKSSNSKINNNINRSMIDVPDLLSKPPSQPITNITYNKICELVNMQNGLPLLAYILDPRYCGYGIKYEIIKEKIENIFILFCNRYKMTEQQLNEVLSEYYSYIDNKNNYNRSKYLEDPIRWWENRKTTELSQKRLQLIVLDILLTPPHQVHLNRFFSVSLNIPKYNKTEMNGDIFVNYMKLNSTIDIKQQYIKKKCYYNFREYKKNMKSISSNEEESCDICPSEILSDSYIETNNDNMFKSDNVINHLLKSLLESVILLPSINCPGVIKLFSDSNDVMLKCDNTLSQPKHDYSSIFPNM